MIVEHNQSANHPSGVGYDNKFKFNGKELDDATQMYYYGARYYDPRISIFVSVDPLAEQTMEPYLYTGNNPIMFTDPTGMSKDGIDSDYRLNRDGTFTLLKSTKDKYDRIFSENENQVPIVVPKSFLKSFSKPKYEGTYEAKIDAKTMKTYGKAIFQFFANNTDKEWSYNEFTNNKTGERTGNIITSLRERTVLDPEHYIQDILDSNSNINWDYSVHNHPGKKDLSTFYPSGWLYNRKKGTFSKTITTTGKVDGDRGVYNSFKIDPKYNYRMPKYHHVTSPYLNKTIKYTDEKFNYIN